MKTGATHKVKEVKLHGIKSVYVLARYALFSDLWFSTTDSGRGLKVQIVTPYYIQVIDPLIRTDQHTNSAEINGWFKFDSQKFISLNHRVIN